MKRRKAAAGVLVASAVLGFGLLAARAQIPGQGAGNPNQVAARVERAPLYLTPPDKFRVPSLLEPVRRVQIMTTADGVLRSLVLSVGSTTRDTQEVAQIDPAEANARLKVAAALVRERQSEHDRVKELVSRSVTTTGELAVAAARLDAAKAEAEIAQIGVDRCSLRAPFAGRILAVPVSAGQYLPKGSVVMDLADTSSLKALVPVDRTAVTVGGKLTVTVEGKGVVATVLAVLPLDESRSVFRELAAPVAAAWINIPNLNNEFEPGQRVMSPYMPNSPLASVPSYSIKQDEEGTSMIQVIRGERVTDVKVRVIGALGPDRSQVTGALRPSDVLVQSSSVPLTAGTFIRFSDTVPAVAVEGAPPEPGAVGDAAAVEPQARPGIAPIGSREAQPPTRKTTSPATKPAGKPAAKGADGVVPF